MSEDLVLTPGGFRPKSFVNFVEAGHGLILDQGVIRKFELATGRKIDLPAPPAFRVTFDAFGPGHTPLAPRAVGGAAAPTVEPGALPDGWQTYAWWDSGAGTSITSFATTWTVPQAPSTNSGQVVFLFNGIQNTGPEFGILQPVLQWGVSAAGGGNFWSVGSWYVTSGGQAFHTTLVPVSPGATLEGVMTQTGSAGGLFNYSSTFQGIPNTTLPVQNIALLHWANETLECYGMNQCSDFPAANYTAMSGISILTGTTRPNLAWTPVDQVTNCGQHATIVSNANPDGEVDLWYHAQPAWHWANQGTPPGLSVAAEVGVLTVMDTPTASQRPYAFVRGSDGHLWVDWWG